MPGSDATVQEAEPQEPCGRPARFAPNNRFGWPKEFLLPLIIEMEIPEVPEAIRGPSPPIDKET
ncbi:MAG: hypothetical protein RBS80_12240 [Thermoguttaceae bacterium]|jgi:hypothetical protein|nr:hypothetical protein [Thermoguttaceae bacterium]